MDASRWMNIAKKYVGLKEIEGGKNNPTIVKFFSEVGHSEVTDDETPWCSAFVGAVLNEAGIEGTGSLLARSWLEWGREVSVPEYGDLVIYKRGNSNWQGHVNFFVKEESGYIIGIGGNQNNSVSVSKYPKSSVIGYRRLMVDEKPREKPLIPEMVAGSSGIVAAIKPFAEANWTMVFIILAVFFGLAWVIYRNRPKPVLLSDGTEVYEESVQEPEPTLKPKPKTKPKKAAAKKAQAKKVNKSKS